MGHCRYAYNPSELYRLTPPGSAPETCCGRPTFPVVDEPETAVIRGPNGEAMAIPTGRLVAREHDDPYCPMHGGSPEPEPQPLTAGELAAARQLYGSLLARFQAAGTLPPGVTESTWQEIQAAGRRLIELDAAPPAAIEAAPAAPRLITLGSRHGSQQ